MLNDTILQLIYDTTLIYRWLKIRSRNSDIRHFDQICI